MPIGTVVQRARAGILSQRRRDPQALLADTRFTGFVQSGRRLVKMLLRLRLHIGELPLLFDEFGTKRVRLGNLRGIMPRDGVQVCGHFDEIVNRFGAEQHVEELVSLALEQVEALGGFVAALLLLGELFGKGVDVGAHLVRLLMRFLDFGLRLLVFGLESLDVGIGDGELGSRQHDVGVGKRSRQQRDGKREQDGHKGQREPMAYWLARFVVFCAK